MSTYAAAAAAVEVHRGLLVDRCSTTLTVEFADRAELVNPAVWTRPRPVSVDPTESWTTRTDPTERAEVHGAGTLAVGGPITRRPHRADQPPALEDPRRSKTPLPPPAETAAGWLVPGHHHIRCPTTPAASQPSRARRLPSPPQPTCPAIAGTTDRGDSSARTLGPVDKWSRNYRREQPDGCCVAIAAPRTGGLSRGLSLLRGRGGGRVWVLCRVCDGFKGQFQSQGVGDFQQRCEGGVAAF